MYSTSNGYQLTKQTLVMAHVMEVW